MFRRSPIVVGLVALVAVALASASSGQPVRPAGPPGGSPPGLDKAIAAKERHAQRLLDQPGIAGIGVGLNPAGKAIIRIYKEKPDVADVPDSLDGVDVQSVTTGILQARAPTDRFPRPVPIGVSSGLVDVATGTLGARVTDDTNVYALSNNHVFAGVNTANIGDPILQPGPIEDGGIDPADRIGTLADFQSINFTSGSTNTMDAAIALTSTSDVGTATPADGYGAPSPITTPAFIGQAVQKYGRTTGLQLGTIAETNVTVDVCYVFFVICFQEARFVNQISVSPGAFSAAGDSGSLIVTQGANQPVALLFAGGDGLTIGSPIDAVLQRFGVTIDGSPPPDGPPSAPTSLSALAGDGTASLTWNPPSFDGGSPLTGYRIYRDTSPNPTSAVADVAAVTSYVDSGLVNGTTYYYKVSALNTNGEGLLSNQASAAPSSLVPPSEPLPTLDGFNRANENPLSDSARWTNGINGSGETGLYVTSNQLACSKTTTCTAWRNAAQYGPDVEVWSRLSTLPGANNQLRLLARVQQVGTAGYDGYMLRPNQLAGTDQILFERVDNGVIVNLLTVNQEFAAGDVFLLRVKGSTVEAWRHDGSVWSRLGTVSDSTYGAVGYTGVGMRGTTGRVDDFGARTMGLPPPDTEPPSAPGTPTATALSSSQIDLSWGPATDNVGVAQYRIERCQGPGCSNFAEIATTAATSYSNTGLSASTAYSYRVRAEDAVPNLGSYSSVASATTSAVAPVEPLPTLDSFNRRNENPLSDSGNWSNGVNGSGETGLRLVSNVLGGTKTTTCTAWRNNPVQYGPDTEVWARITTLPGTNNQFRLYARLQQPGTATYDGYMLRTNQLSGTDQVWIDRVDNGAIVNRLTMNRELAVGDTLLLSVRGSTLQAWLRRGTTWSLLGSVTDSTYGGAGYVGVGIRGKTGRLDDFGAR